MPQNKFNIPNLLSASRLVMAPCAIYVVVSSDWYWAVAIFWLAIATDLADGYIARKTHTTTSFGGLLDHASDAVLVSSFLFALSYIGLVPILLPILVVAAFLQYVFDSKALTGQPLRASFLGRHNGIFYFVVAGFPIMQQALNVQILSSQGLIYLSYVMIFSTLVSMTDRLWTLIKVTRLGHKKTLR